MKYSLKFAIAVISLIAVLCGIGTAFPQQTLFVALILALLLVVLLPYMAGQLGLVLMGISELRDIFPFLSTASSSSETPTMTRAGIVFLFSTALLIATYPLTREISSSFSLLSLGIDGEPISLGSVLKRASQRLSIPSLRRILYMWGILHVLKWTVFFGFFTVVFGLAFASRKDLKHLISRLLYFSPWLFVLHFLMLIGVWMDDPNISGPEYSGWYWGCCIEPTWLKRLGVPMLIVGYVYLTYVLQISLKFATLFAAVLTPLAILATVAVNELGLFLH